MANLEAKIDALSTQLASLVEHQRKRDELLEELMPIAKEMMAVSSDRLASLEQRGYFDFGRSLLHVLDNVVQGYTAQDVEQLASSIVGILDAVRASTQPHMLKMIAELGEVVEHADEAKPVGVMGTLKAASRDEQVQRGMAVLLQVLRQVGKGAETMGRRERLRRQLAARRDRARTTAPAGTLAAGRVRRASVAPAASPAAADAPASAPSSTPPAAAPAPAPAAATTPPSRARPDLPGIGLTEEGFLVDAAQWNREVAQKIAASLGVAELTEQHWTLIEFARAEYAQTGASPNIRRLSKGSGIGTKEIYGMFPKTPGKYTAMVAGLPKPVGCI